MHEHNMHHQLVTHSRIVDIHTYINIFIIEIAALINSEAGTFIKLTTVHIAHINHPRLYLICIWPSPSPNGVEYYYGAAAAAISVYSLAQL